jgi:drug/metabolite transporter (DMT)-like permease
MSERAHPSGIACMVAAVFLFALMAVFVKLIGEAIPAHGTVFLRSLATVPVIWWMCRRRGLSPLGKKPLLLVARGVCGTLGMVLYFVSIAELPLGNAVLLTHASPLFSAWFAALFLGERAGRGVWIAAAACLAGIALIARPSPVAPLAASAVALGSAVLNGVTYTVVRAATRHDHPLVIVFALPVFSTLMTAVPTVLDWATPGLREWLLIAGVTITAIGAQVLMTMAFQREPAGRATNVFFLGPVLAILSGQFLGDPPLGAMDVCGAALVLSGVVGLALARGRGPTLGRVA